MTRSSLGSRGSQTTKSPSLTLSDFDPENEAIMSTRQLDSNPQQLPQLRASAQKYSRFSRPSKTGAVTQPEPDYAINTSAIGRAFPDFSQGGASSDESSTSIEVGRGGNKIAISPNHLDRRTREHSSRLDLDDDSLDFAAPSVGKYDVMSTPPLQQASLKQGARPHGPPKQSSQNRQSSGLRHEVMVSNDAPAKITDYGSGGSSGKGSGEHGRTLAAMHARVTDQYDMSRIGEDRPPTIDLSIKNTRFSTTKQHLGNAVPTRFSTSQGLTTGTNLHRKSKILGASTPTHGTQQSFLLPELANMSELVSNVYDDVTPMDLPHGKERASRFKHRARNGPVYANVDELPVPEDEQAIFLSLKLLQDKVVVLERHQADAEEIIQMLQQENERLENRATAQRKTSHRSDSALGTTDSDGEDLSGSRRLTIEKNRLESSVRTLQSQLDVVHRKSSTTDTILRSIINERDSAVSQLNHAHTSIAQLTSRNKELEQEVAWLKAQGTSLRPPNADISGSVKGLKHSQRTSKASSGSQCKAKYSSSDSEEAEFEKALNIQADAPESAKKKHSNIFDLRCNKKASEQTKRTRATLTGGNEVAARRVFKNKKSDKLSSEPDLELGTDEGDGISRDLTYLSFQNSSDVARLRRDLERELIEHKQRQSSGRQSSAVDPVTTMASHGMIKTDTLGPRRSSMKDLTSKPVDQTPSKNQEQHEEKYLEHRRRHSDTSMVSARSQRRTNVATDLTSAFILPDITLHAPGHDVSRRPETNSKDVNESDGGSRHNVRHCTICNSSFIVGKQCTHGKAVGGTKKIPKPVPVSERYPSVGEEEHTMRPSQAPGLALAAVLKGLEDEIAHSKMQLCTYQKLYNSHDPSLGKRKRESVYRSMVSFMKVIEIKSEQVYALYDVLEGQKQDGHEMTEAEVTMTLQSVGVDPKDLGPQNSAKITKSEGTTKEAGHRPWDLDSANESEEDLPWEGIETTVETTKSGYAPSKQRVKAAS